MSIAILKFRIKDASRAGLDVYYSAIKIGEMLVGCDGFYAFWPELRGGFWEAYVMRALADSLDKLNEPWQKQIDEFFMITDNKVADIHSEHGRGEDGPDDVDCPCRGTAQQADCALSGCGFCIAALGQALNIKSVKFVTPDETGSQYEFGIKRIEQQDDGSQTVVLDYWPPCPSMKAFYDPLGPKPIDMILFCPVCGYQHIDAPEDAMSITNSGDTGSLWTNPPHRSHLCKRCGCIWRPADVSTNGVDEIKTCGKHDTATIAHRTIVSPSASHFFLTEIREVISQMTSQQWAGFATIPLRAICDWRDRLSRAIGDVPFDGIARDAGASKNPEQPKRKWYHTPVGLPAPSVKKEMEKVYQVKLCTDGRYIKPEWKEVSYSEFKAAQGKPFHATRILLIDTDAQ